MVFVQNDEQLKSLHIQHLDINMKFYLIQNTFACDVYGTKQSIIEIQLKRSEERQIILFLWRYVID